jgi:2-dehydro-3-deoxyphosphooctonate aldolase (KDO 8-P synthase)
MQIRDIPVGDGAPLVLISGLNVLESLDGALSCAHAVAAIADRHGMPAIFKASFDKANRSSRHSYRGPGLDEGLRILERVKADAGIPVTTDIHEPGQAKMVAEVADLLQIPSFHVVHAVDKAQGFGASGVIVTERGTTFGYHDLIVDMRGLAAMRRYAPVCLDATHSVQHPGAGTIASSGDRSFVAPLARAGAALGVDALFIETHPDPDTAPCDGACQILLGDLDRLLAEVCAIRNALEEFRA